MADFKTLYERAKKETKRRNISPNFQHIAAAIPIIDKTIAKQKEDEISDRKKVKETQEKILKTQQAILQHSQDSTKAGAKWKVVALIEAVILIILGILTLCF